MYPNRKPFGFALVVLRQVLVSRGPNQKLPFYVVLFLAFYYPMDNLSVPEQRNYQLPVTPMLIASG
jgi:hypothetical protein